MTKLDIFCTVIDNYGDAGVCLHLARTMSKMNFQVRLWCDKLNVLEQISNAQDQTNPNLELKAWRDLKTYTCPQVVINAFNCRLDQCVIQGIQQQEKSTHPVVVINLDYLSAEDWIEGCHGLTSFADGICCYYFFPGFTPQTGGLNVEMSFIQQCKHLLSQSLSNDQANFQMNAAHLDTSASLNEATKASNYISLFSYHNVALKPLIESLAHDNEPVVLQVFSGLALDNLNQLTSLQLSAGQSTTYGSLHIQALPMVSQEEYDSILLQSCCNLVRGEDSIIRAMHTGQPFLWQIYKQEENAHIIKLQSFLDKMHSILSSLPNNSSWFSHDDMNYLKQCMLAYNEAANYPEDFCFEQFILRTKPLFQHFALYLCEQEPLSYRLISFIKNKLPNE